MLEITKKNMHQRRCHAKSKPLLLKLDIGKIKTLENRMFCY